MYRSLVFLFSILWCFVGYADIPSAYSDVAKLKSVPADILYAIAVTESVYRYTNSKSGSVVHEPWPWSLNINRTAFRFDSRVEAYRVLKESVNQGQSVDAGIMQINWRWHKHQFDSMWSILDPYTNLLVGADILVEQYQKTFDWWAAVGAYHAPGLDKASLRRAEEYRKRVRKNWLVITKRIQ